MPRDLRAGFPTYWTTFGQGPRAALMIHCSLSHSGSWGGMARELSGALTMTAFDMPGHGRSAAWDERGEIQAVTTAMAASFNREGCSRRKTNDTRYTNTGAQYIKVAATATLPREILRK